MLSSLLVFLIVGIVSLVVLGLALAIVGTLFGAAVGLAGFLLFKVVPIILVGYLVVRFLRPRERRLPPADRRWLEE